MSLKDRVDAQRSIGTTHGDKIATNPKGRPLKQESQKKTKIIPVRVTEQEYEDIKVHAKSLGLAVSTFLGMLAIKNIKKNS